MPVNWNKWSKLNDIMTNSKVTSCDPEIGSRPLKWETESYQRIGNYSRIKWQFWGVLLFCFAFRFLVGFVLFFWDRILLCVQPDLELMTVLLHQPSNCWNYRCVPPCPAKWVYIFWAYRSISMCLVSRIELRTLYLPDRYLYCWAMFPALC